MMAKSFHHSILHALSKYCIRELTQNNGISSSYIAVDDMSH